MDAVGVICEYNPFHKGHAYQLSEARRLTGCDAVICVMSGSFVQRGEPAIFRKGARAETAVRCGADLVLELPLPWAISSAEGFGFGGVSLLEATGVCSHIAFGSESGDAAALQNVAHALCSPEADTLIRGQMALGVSYAAARQSAAEHLAGEDAKLLLQPNDLLAVEYLKALECLATEIKPIAVKRYGAAHNSGEAAAASQSAMAIRQQMETGSFDFSALPDAAAEVFRGELDAGRGPVFSGALEPMLMARLRTMTDEDYAALPCGSDGLAQRFMRSARIEPTVSDVLEKVKTKRYVMSRLRRLLLYALLGITEAHLHAAPPYLRVLAMNDTGREVLAQMKKTASLPILTKPAAVRTLSPEAQELFALEAKADDLYALCYPGVQARRGGTIWITTPTVIGGKEKE